MDEYRFEFRVEKMCKVLGGSRSGYYAWKNRPESNRSKENAILLGNIKKSHERSRGTYGSIRVTGDLKLQGFACSKNRVVTTLWQNHSLVP